MTMKYYINFLAIILTIILSYGNVLSQCNHPDDYTTLRALYLSTNGDNWTNNNGWPSQAQFLANPTPLSGTDLSGWYGIQCDNGRAFGVNLPSNQLTGTIHNVNMTSLESYHQNSLKNDVPFKFFWCPLFILLMNLHTFSV
jgi:hypothetical protein